MTLLHRISAKLRQFWANWIKLPRNLGLYCHAYVVWDAACKIDWLGKVVRQLLEIKIFETLDKDDMLLHAPLILLGKEKAVCFQSG